jgi:Resolvase, N terminal domain
MVATVSTGSLIGYARVSTDDQVLSLPIDSLTSLGVHQCDIFSEKVSGAKSDRPEWNACRAKLHHGDTLVPAKCVVNQNHNLLPTLGGSEVRKIDLPRRT